MDLREIGWDGMDWIDLAQDRDQWRALMYTVMKLLSGCTICGFSRRAQLHVIIIIISSSTDSLLLLLLLLIIIIIIISSSSSSESVHQRAIGWTAGVRFPRGQDCSVLHSVQTGSGPTNAPNQWVSGTVSLEVKRQERETDHSPPFSAEVENGGAIHSLHYTSSSHGV
jgi:hypothetical protein